MPGLRVFRCLRPPFVHGVGSVRRWQGSARRGARADGAAARADASGTTPSTRTRRAASSASCSPAMLGVPHLYDMHSSLPQQLTQFRLQPVAAADARVFGCDRALRDPALAGRDRDLPAARGDRARHRSGRADGADRERAGLGRCAGRRARAQPFARDARARRRRRRWCSTPARSRPIRGSTCCSPRRASSWRDAPGRAVRARRRASRIRSRGARAGARAPGVGDVVIFAGQRPAEEIPAYLDAADVLVSPRSTRHEHAAQDLPVPRARAVRSSRRGC